MPVACGSPQVYLHQNGGVHGEPDVRTDHGGVYVVARLCHQLCVVLGLNGRPCTAVRLDMVTPREPSEPTGLKELVERLASLTNDHRHLRKYIRHRDRKLEQSLPGETSLRVAQEFFEALRRRGEVNSKADGGAEIERFRKWSARNAVLGGIFLFAVSPAWSLPLGWLKPSIMQPAARLALDVVSAAPVLLMLAFFTFDVAQRGELGRTHRAVLGVGTLVGAVAVLCLGGAFLRRPLELLDGVPDDRVLRTIEGPLYDRGPANIVSLEGAQVVWVERDRARHAHLRLDIRWIKDQASAAKREYRGWVHYVASPRLDAHGRCVLGPLELRDYSLGPATRLLSYLLGSVEVDWMMARHDLKIAAPVRELAVLMEQDCSSGV